MNEANGGGSERELKVISNDVDSFNYFLRISKNKPFISIRNTRNKIKRKYHTRNISANHVWFTKKGVEFNEKIRDHIQHLWFTD